MGFDTEAAYPDDPALARIVRGADTSCPAVRFTIPDSREGTTPPTAMRAHNSLAWASPEITFWQCAASCPAGWVESLRLLIDSCVDGTAPVEFNYDLVRPAGEPIRGFGGVASGPEPLRELHEQVRATLERNRGRPLSVTAIVDIMNFIGKCVVSGNVRQTAEIAFGRADSDEYIDLKNYALHPHRAAYGWTSNNSLFCTPGQVDYARICERVRLNGEPGFFFLDNARRFSRMNGVPDGKDWRAGGGNPCLEQTLESYELCCLVETFPNNHATLAEFLDTLEVALEYAKTVTLGLPHWAESAEVVARNRRIGCSMSGLAQFISQRGLEALRQWCEDGYAALQAVDERCGSSSSASLSGNGRALTKAFATCSKRGRAARLAAQFGVPRSIKLTSIKPSGTVSLLAGGRRRAHRKPAAWPGADVRPYRMGRSPRPATPGMHYPESRFCIRRVRLGKTSALAKQLREAGYPMEDVVGDSRSVAVEFPVDMGANIRSLDAVPMWEQLALAAFLQRHWSDNQVRRLPATERDAVGVVA